jgi:hypothetical protein
MSGNIPGTMEITLRQFLSNLGLTAAGNGGINA